MCSFLLHLTISDLTLLDTQFFSFFTYHREPKSSHSSSSKRAVLPKLVPMDSVVQPQPQINPDAGSACNEQNARDSARQRVRCFRFRPLFS